MYGYKEIHSLKKDWEGRLIRYAEEFLHDPAAAKKIVSTALTGLIRLGYGQSAPMKEPEIFLFKTVRFLCSAKVRVPENFLTSPEKLPMPGLQSDIQKLSGDEQEVLSLRFEQGLSFSKISGILKISKKNVLQLLQKAKDHLKGNDNNI